MTRSTNRSTPGHGDHRMPVTERYRRRVDIPGLREAGDVVDLDYPPFFIDRVEDAVPPGPQAPQIRRPCGLAASVRCCTASLLTSYLSRVRLAKPYSRA